MVTLLAVTTVLAIVFCVGLLLGRPSPEMWPYVVAVVIALAASGWCGGYLHGQLSAAKGSQAYRLVDKPDGSREWSWKPATATSPADR